MANNAHIIARQIAYDLVNNADIVPTFTIPPLQDDAPQRYVVVNPGTASEAGTKQKFGQTGQLEVIVIERQTTTTGTMALIDTIVDSVILALKPSPQFLPLSPSGANVYIWYIESIDSGILPIPQGRSIFSAIRITYTVEFLTVNN
jgi:hypothetical protein